MARNSTVSKFPVKQKMNFLNVVLPITDTHKWKRG